MHDDDYYYEERQKSRGKSERMLIGSIASILGGIIGGVIAVLFFLVSRFDILSSGIAALVFYICTYHQKWNGRIYIVAIIGIFSVSMLLQYRYKLFRILYLLLTCGCFAVLGTVIIGYDTEVGMYLVMGGCVLATVFLGVVSWSMIMRECNGTLTG